MVTVRGLWDGQERCPSAGIEMGFRRSTQEWIQGGKKRGPTALSLRKTAHKEERDKLTGTC